MLRLAFHDCVKYKKGGGGCDGCLNLDKNLDDNNGLQYTIAVLEKLFMDKDFPEDASPLTDSPQNLGISRADLWAFAGLVALDEFQIKTKSNCHYQNNWSLDFTCGDTNHTCYNAFPDTYQDLFLTGRKDCVPKDNAGPNHQYLSSKTEVHPNLNGGSKATTEFFQENFKLYPREGLALLGIHTIGHWNTMISHTDYAWVRSHSKRTQLFNHEYFRILTSTPAKVKDHFCTGDLKGLPANATFHPFANAFVGAFGKPDPYAKPTQPGALQWRMSYVRGPTCEENEEDQKEFWNKGHLNKIAQGLGFDGTFYKMCCHQMQNGLEVHPDCQQDVQGRLRMSTSELGYVFDIGHNENGLPTGCSNFEGKSERNFFNSQDLGPADCQTTKIKDKGFNKKQLVSDVAKTYANDNQAWLKDLIPSYAKMISNGYKKKDLKKNKVHFWTHTCCFHTGIIFGSKNVKILTNDTLKTALECQKLCKGEEKCNHFSFDEDAKECKLFQEIKIDGVYKKTSYTFRHWQNGKFIVSGPKVCPNDSNICTAFE